MPQPNMQQMLKQVQKMQAEIATIVRRDFPCGSRVRLTSVGYWNVDAIKRDSPELIP